MSSTRTRIRTLAHLGLLAASLAAFGTVASTHTAEAQTRRHPATARTAEAPPQGVVNINTATVEELSLLPGIGGSKAQAIVSSRERRPFQRVEDILRVRGIGRATFRRLRPMLRVQGRTTLAAAAPARPNASTR